MKLSIIVPVYNAQSFLEKCLDSLVQQSIDDYEIILINDGSTDASQEIVERYAASFPQLIRAIAVENSGQAKARNLGLELAQGDYIGFVDSDDWIDKAMYEKLYNAAQAESADITVCGFAECFDDGRFEKRVPPRNSARLSMAGSCCNKLFRKELIGDVRYPEGLWYEDFSFSAKLLLKARQIAVVEEALYFYRIGHISTMTNKNAKKNLDMLTVMRDLQSYIELHGSRDELEYLVINHVLLDSINRLARQDNPEKASVIKLFRDYVHSVVPRLSDCASYKQESRNRRIVMSLNYHGLENVSKLLLKMKKAL